MRKHLFIAAVLALSAGPALATSMDECQRIDDEAHELDEIARDTLRQSDIDLFTWKVSEFHACIANLGLGLKW